MEKRCKQHVPYHSRYLDITVNSIMKGFIPFQVTVPSNSTVMILKLEIFDECGMFPWRQMLFFQGKELKPDSSTLKSHGILENGNIMLSTAMATGFNISNSFIDFKISQSVSSSLEEIEEIEKAIKQYVEQGKAEAENLNHSSPDLTKCQKCKKKLSLVAQSMKCECQNVFCSKHQKPEEHSCSIDYKKKGREKLLKENPKVDSRSNQKDFL